MRYPQLDRWTTYCCSSRPLLLYILQKIACTGSTRIQPSNASTAVSLHIEARLSSHRDASILISSYVVFNVIPTITTHQWNPLYHRVVFLSRGSWTESVLRGCEGRWPLWRPASFARCKHPTRAEQKMPTSTTLLHWSECGTTVFQRTGHIRRFSAQLSVKCCCAVL